MDWPAQELLCRRLGISYSRTKGNGTDFALCKALLSCLRHKPWHCCRILSVLNVYFDCKLYIHALRKEAGKVRNSRNQEIVNHILRQAGASLIREPQDHWPELIGLFTQKLVHVGYYEEICEDR
jgi:hypothetical protein